MSDRLSKDRREAGHPLGERVARWFAARPGYDAPVVYALPRGGVPVGAEVAAAVAAPLDPLLVRKLRAPFMPELALGAVVDGGTPMIVRNEAIVSAFHVSEAVMAAELRDALTDIERRRGLWCGSRPPLRATGRDAVVVDDGAATGATAQAALKALRQGSPRSVLFATPVAAADAIQRLLSVTDDIIALEPLAPYGSTGQRYPSFDQFTDEDVSQALARAAARLTPRGGQSWPGPCSAAPPLDRFVTVAL